MSFVSIKSAIGRAYARFLKGKADALEKRFLDAAEQSNLPEIDRCIDVGVNINCKDGDLCTALHIAAERGDMPLAIKLLESPNILINLKTYYGNTPLHAACQNQQIRMARLLLQNGADPNARDHFDRTPLHIVVLANSTTLVRLLVENGAEVNVIDSMDNTPLHLAAIEKCYLSMVKLLFRYGADPQMKIRNMSLFLECVLACHTKQMLKIICCILNHINNACINDKDKIAGRNALHFVALSGYSPLAEELLERGCNAFMEDFFRKKPIDIAITHGNDEVAFILENHMYPNLYAQSQEWENDDLERQDI